MRDNAFANVERYAFAVYNSRGRAPGGALHNVDIRAAHGQVELPQGALKQIPFDFYESFHLFSFYIAHIDELRHCVFRVKKTRPAALLYV